MKPLLLTLLFCCFLLRTTAQDAAAIDSIKRKLEQASTPHDRVAQLMPLSRLMMNINLTEADKYAKEMIQLAEMSRDRRLMFSVLLADGDRWANLAASRENNEKAIHSLQEALRVARQNRLDSQACTANLALSATYLNLPDLPKAVACCYEASNFATSLKDDSMRARVEFQFGSINLQKNEKIAALRNILTGLRIGEELNNPTLIRVAYSRLSIFYSSIDDTERAIDYAEKAYKMLDLIRNGSVPYVRVQDLNKIGRLYSSKKSYDVAMTYYERALKLTDSLKFAPLKSLIYQSIVNDYSASDQPQKAIDYFNSHPQMVQYLKAVKFDYFIDQAYGYMYSRLGKYDSALYFYNRVAPVFETEVNAFNKLGFNYEMGLLFKKMGNQPKALDYMLKANDIAMQIGQLEQMSTTTAELDSMYRSMGNYEKALQYSSLHFQYKDSLASLGKEKDMLQLEIQDEQQRQARVEKEAVEIKRKRDNIQYLGITIGIASLFVLLVMLGMFKVSALTIKMIGFFTFLMFFEFIFLIFKKNIYSITKGEPWRDLLFMICLAAILLPLHHWLEHKVIHYLTSRNRLTESGRSLREKLLRRKNQA